jgi:hypothetical protein
VNLLKRLLVGSLKETLFMTREAMQHREVLITSEQSTFSFFTCRFIWYMGFTEFFCVVCTDCGTVKPYFFVLHIQKTRVKDTLAGCHMHLFVCLFVCLFVWTYTSTPVELGKKFLACGARLLSNPTFKPFSQLIREGRRNERTKVVSLVLFL